MEKRKIEGYDHSCGKWNCQGCVDKGRNQLIDEFKEILKKWDKILDKGRTFDDMNFRGKVNIIHRNIKQILGRTK